jgi:hypothetical protein
MLSIADGATAPDWGYMLFAKLAGAVTPSISNLVAVAVAAAPTLIVHTPIEAGTWHYKCIGFTTTGVKGAVSVADANCVVS